MKLGILVILPHNQSINIQLCDYHEWVLTETDDYQEKPKNYPKDNSTQWVQCISVFGFMTHAFRWSVHSDHQGK